MCFIVTVFGTRPAMLARKRFIGGTDHRFLADVLGLCKGISPQKYGQKYGTNVPPCNRILKLPLILYGVVLPV